MLNNNNSNNTYQQSSLSLQQKLLNDQSFNNLTHKDSLKSNPFYNVGSYFEPVLNTIATKLYLKKPAQKIPFISSQQANDFLKTGKKPHKKNDPGEGEVEDERQKATGGKPEGEKRNEAYASAEREERKGEEHTEELQKGGENFEDKLPIPSRDRLPIPSSNKHNIAR